MMTRGEVRLLRESLQAELDRVGAASGFRLTLGNATFGETAVFKLEAARLRPDGTADSRAAADFRRYAALFGLEAGDLGRTFASRGRTFTVSGVKPRSGKFPVLATRADGKVFKFAAADVRRLLGRP